MTKHDEVRQILHQAGFKFADGRTALDLTDEEVEKVVVQFIGIMAKFGQQARVAIETILVNLVKGMNAFREDLDSVLSEAEYEAEHLKN